MVEFQMGGEVSGEKSQRGLGEHPTGDQTRPSLSLSQGPSPEAQVLLSA